MDPITQAIILGIAGNLATDAVKAAYQALKNALTTKFGESSDLAEAVSKLEAKPDSKGRKDTVQEEVAAVKANDDPQLLQLAQQVINLVKEQPGGQQVITQNISNVKFAATSGTGNASISGINEHPATDNSK